MSEIEEKVEFYSEKIIDIFPRITECLLKSIKVNSKKETLKMLGKIQSLINRWSIVINRIYLLKRLFAKRKKRINRRNSIKIIIFRCYKY